MKQHYLPKFYLRGFMQEFPKKKGKLFEFDLQEMRQRGPCRPKDVTWSTDFYNADDPLNEHPDEVEHFYDKEIESKAAPVLFSIFESKVLPHGEDRAYLLLFIASLAARIPAIRDGIEAVVNHEFRDPALALTRSPERFQEFVSSTPILVPPELLESVRSHMEQRLREGRMANEVALRHSLRAMFDLWNFLSSRALRLGICEDSAPNLVCSDWPLRLPNPDTADSGHDDSQMLDSVLLFRLNKRMVLLIGRNGPECEDVFSWEEALAVNRLAVLSAYRAYRFVYSADRDFVFLGDGGVEWHVEDLRDHLESRHPTG